MLTPSLQQRCYTAGNQNMCRTKPDKATLGSRSGTANRSYLYTIPGSHSNTEPDEFTLAQTCRTESPFFLSTEVSLQTVRSAPRFCAPTTTIHLDSLTAGHPHGTQTHLCAPTINTNCRIHCWHGACLNHQDKWVPLFFLQLQRCQRAATHSLLLQVLSQSRQQTVLKLQLHLLNHPDWLAWPPV